MVGQSCLDNMCCWSSHVVSKAVSTVNRKSNKKKTGTKTKENEEKMILF